MTPVQGWGHMREAYAPERKALMIDGKPIDLDLTWITGPLERKIEGFRGDPPKVREEGRPVLEEDRWGAKSFTMPASKQKVDARRATPLRASG